MRFASAKHRLKVIKIRSGGIHGVLFGQAIVMIFPLARDRLFTQQRVCHINFLEK